MSNRSREQLASPVVLVAAGWGCIVLGGLVAAVTGPLALTQGSWLAAYLVLVGGVSQVAMGQARTCHHQGHGGAGALGQAASWNAGNCGVVVGTLVGEPLLVDLGSMLLVVALVLALRAARPDDSRGVSRSRTDRLITWTYRGLLVLLLVSIPIGMVLAHVRHD